MSIDAFFEYMKANPNASLEDVQAALNRIPDARERELASASVWEFVASLRDDGDAL